MQNRIKKLVDRGRGGITERKEGNEGLKSNQVEEAESFFS